MRKFDTGSFCMFNLVCFAEWICCLISFLQALLANMAAMYAVYHGPEGLKTIAHRVHGLAGVFAFGLQKLGTVEVQSLLYFDTVKVKVADAQAVADAAYKSKINLRVVDKNTVSSNS